MARRGRFYTLEVVQNPVRARMCGFGDKVRPALVLSRFYRLISACPLRIDDR